MTPELMYLVWSAALTFVLVLIAVSGATLQAGCPSLPATGRDCPKWQGGRDALSVPTSTCWKA